MNPWDLCIHTKQNTLYNKAKRHTLTGHSIRNNVTQSNTTPQQLGSGWWSTEYLAPLMYVNGVDKILETPCRL